MKKHLILICALYPILGLNAQTYQQTPIGVETTINHNNIEIQFFSPQIVRVIKYPQGKALDKTSYSVVKSAEKTKFKVKHSDNMINISSSELKVGLDLTTGEVLIARPDGKLLIKEKEYSSILKPISYPSGKTLEVGQSFILDEDEAIYGLGQHQQGVMNHRGKEVLLRQKNTEIAIPIVHSVKGYALFWDNYSPSTFKDSAEGMKFTSTSGTCIDYYFMYGQNADGVISQIRDLTGQAPMFPLWTYGFWQSKERYTSQEQPIEVVKKYRDLNIPLDGIIQDWQYWGTDEKHWNAVEFTNPLFSNPQKMIDDAHNLNAHMAISVWPSFGSETNIFKELQEENLLLDFKTFPKPASVYDTYNPRAREIYWNYMHKHMFSIGMDSWWLDATEPEYEGGEDELNQMTYLGIYRDVYNAFPLFSVGGVYDSQRKVTSNKRVFILTRSAFAGQQRYGANSWSGDVKSSWRALKEQITGGLNFSLSGIPYWNSDIGGFVPHHTYPTGVKELTFHELYVRWLQFATFTPMMRSHGTTTPREIYQFGKKGDWSFDVQEKFINFRYSLLPYLYSTAHDITSNSGSMMRSLIMDFAEDKNVHNIDNQYMFGHSLLVAPVTDSMYVDKINDKFEADFSRTRYQEVYLPNKANWYDFWTGEYLKGGQKIDRATPIDIIPLYVRAGTILTWGPKVQYAEEKRWDNLDLFIYPGADAEFVLYEDENNNYNYEKGAFSTIKLKWNDKSQTLMIDKRVGNYPGMLDTRNFNITILTAGKKIEDNQNHSDKTITYEGKKINVKFK